MKDRILKDWNVKRLLYLAMGTVVIAQAVVTTQYIFGLAGAYLAVMSILNIGCASGRCAYTPPKPTQQKRNPH